MQINHVYYFEEQTSPSEVVSGGPRSALSDFMILESILY